MNKEEVRSTVTSDLAPVVGSAACGGTVAEPRTDSAGLEEANAHARAVVLAAAMRRMLLMDAGIIGDTSPR